METRKIMILDTLQLDAGKLGVEVHTFDEEKGSILLATRDNQLMVHPWEIDSFIKTLNKAKKLLKSEIGSLEREEEDG